MRPQDWGRKCDFTVGPVGSRSCAPAGPTGFTAGFGGPREVHFCFCDRPRIDSGDHARPLGRTKNVTAIFK